MITQKSLVLSITLLITPLLYSQEPIQVPQQIDWQNTLFEGVEKSNVKKVEEALAHGADVNARYGSANKPLLIMAIEKMIRPYKMIEHIYDQKTEKDNIENCMKSIIIATI